VKFIRTILKPIKINAMEHLKYPIGRFSFPETLDADQWKVWKETISTFHDHLEDVVSGMTQEQLDTTYRPEGWTARQVIHHIADSHSHALIRFKWALTEDKPMIKPYLEAKYAMLPDYSLPIDAAMWMLKGLHVKWSHIMQHMIDTDWEKGYFHPETGKFFSLYDAAALYSWHCRHHLEHVKLCKI